MLWLALRTIVCNYELPFDETDATSASDPPTTAATAASSTCSSSDSAAPFETALVGDLYIAPADAKFPPDRPAQRFLTYERNILVTIARMIANAAREEEWRAVTVLTLRRMEMGNWHVSNAVRLMRRGMRDLDTLCEDVSVSSKAVIEFLLLQVRSFEMQSVQEEAAAAAAAAGGRARRDASAATASALDGDSEADDEKLPPGPPMLGLPRTLSVGSETASQFDVLQRVIRDRAELKSVLQQLLLR